MSTIRDATKLLLRAVVGATQEKQLGQKFIVDATLYCDFSKAAESDALKDTVNYAAVYRHLLTFPASRRTSSCAMQMHEMQSLCNVEQHMCAARAATFHLSMQPRMRGC